MRVFSVKHRDLNFATPLLYSPTTIATDTNLQVDRHMSHLNLHSVFLPVVGVEEDMARHDIDHCILVNTADMAELLRTTLSKEPEISMCVAKRISKQNTKTARHMHLPIVLAVFCSSDYEVSHKTFKHVDRDFMLSV